MTLATSCPACSGRGTWIREPCPDCNGSGRAPFNRAVTATVPAGIDSGMRLRLAGEGEHPESGGATGDLYIFIQVEEHPRFRREGNNLHTRVTVSYLQAILGAELSIELLGEEIPFSLAPGTQPGAEVRIEQRGVPNIGRGGSGDLVVTIDVAIPQELTSAQRELVERLAELEQS